VHTFLFFFFVLKKNYRCRVRDNRLITLLNLIFGWSLKLILVLHLAGELYWDGRQLKDLLIQPLFCLYTLAVYFGLSCMIQYMHTRYSFIFSSRIVSILMQQKFWLIRTILYRKSCSKTQGLFSLIPLGSSHKKKASWSFLRYICRLQDIWACINLTFRLFSANHLSFIYLKLFTL
jgi:hypothetical protein